MTSPSESKDLTPYIDVRVKMPKDMMHALNIHECKCVVTKVKLVSEDEVRAFLTVVRGPSMAARFKREYLLVPDALQ